MTGRGLFRFTPSVLPPETLEAIFVQREPVAQRIIELIRESVLTDNKHHTLITGPRGIGKTHLVSVICHRVRAQADLRDRLLVAWLREEEWGVTSFFDLIRRIVDRLARDYRDDSLRRELEQLHGMPREVLAAHLASVLRLHVGGRTLLVVVENLDVIFDGLQEAGQKELRSFIQENPTASEVGWPRPAPREHGTFC